MCSDDIQAENEFDNLRKMNSQLKKAVFLKQQNSNIGW